MRIVRVASPIIPLILATACTAEPSISLTTRSVLQAPADEIALQDGSGLADAAMVGQICVIDTEAGEAITDHDLADGIDRLLDAHAGLALAEAGGDLFALDGTTLEAVPALGVNAFSGVVLDDGLAILGQDVNGCAVGFGDSVWSVPGLACDGAGFAADRASGTAWIADGSALASVTREGRIAMFEGVDADLVKFDTRNQSVVLSSVGSDTLRASRADGTIAWTVKVAGLVQDVEVAGGAGMVVASVRTDAGGEIIVLDGLTGGQVVTHPVPEAVDVSISSDGLSLALLAADAVYFYDVDPNAGLLDTPTTEQVSDMNGASSTAILGIPLVTAAAASAFID